MRTALGRFRTTVVEEVSRTHGQGNPISANRYPMLIY